MKKYIVSAIAIVIIAVASAFTFASKPSAGKILTPQWHYKLSTVAGENTATNYEPASGSYNCPGSSGVRCVIAAPDAGGKPDLSNVTEISFKP